MFSKLLKEGRRSTSYKRFSCNQDLAKYYSSLSSKKQSDIGIVEKIQNIKSYDEVPGPKIWPVIGSILSLKGFGMSNFINLINNRGVFRRLFRRLGTF